MKRDWDPSERMDVLLAGLANGVADGIEQGVSQPYEFLLLLWGDTGVHAASTLDDNDVRARLQTLLDALDARIGHQNNPPQVN